MRVRLPLRQWASTAFGVLVDSGREFQNDRAKRLGAGIAYYALFAVIPALLLAGVIAAAFVGKEAARGGLLDGLADVVGDELAAAIETAIASLYESNTSSGFAIVGLVVIAYSASVLFVAVRDTLELIWDVPYEPGLEISLRRRAFGIVVPLLAGVLLGVVLLVGAVVGMLDDWLRSPFLEAMVQLAGSALSVVIGVGALGLLYRHAARARRPPWTHVWPATLIVAAAYALGGWAFGVYLNVVGGASLAGAASAVVVGLGLVYYAAQILLFGAEVIKVLDQRAAQS